MTYEKLVRDGIPDSIVAAGETPCIRVLESDEEYSAALAQKLVEEAGEVGAATNKEKKTKELADLLEVMHAYAEHHEIPWLHIMWQRTRRWREVGGFKKRIFLIKVKSKEFVGVF